MEGKPANIAPDVRIKRYFPPKNHFETRWKDIGIEFAWVCRRTRLQIPAQDRLRKASRPRTPANPGRGSADNSMSHSLLHGGNRLFHPGQERFDSAIALFRVASSIFPLAKSVSP